MKVLLTGAMGFVGKNFLLLRPKSWQITALDINQDKNFLAKIGNTTFIKIDLTNKDKVKSLAKKMPKFDACLHLAANGDPALSVPDPIWDLQMTTQTLINVVSNFDISKVIYLSSGAVYDGNNGLVTKNTVVNPKLPYAISHQAAEEYVRYFQKIGKINNYIIIRFFGAYGPYEPERKIYTKLYKAFGIDKKSDFTICGDGKNLIDAMYIADAVKGLEKAILSDKKNITVDFCKGEHPNINQLVKEAAKVFDINIKIKHQGQVPEYNRFYASNTEFERLFKFRPKITLSEGLQKLKEHIKTDNF